MKIPMLPKQETDMRAPFLLLVGAWILFVAMRLCTLTRDWHLDEFATLEVLAAPSFWQAMQIVRADPHHPGFFALLYAWQQVGHARIWLRLLPLCFDIATLTLVARVVWQHYSMRPGRWIWRLPVALGLWGCNPLALRFAAELRPYSALICTSLWAYCRCSESASTKVAPRLAAQVGLAAILCLPTLMHPAGLIATLGILAAVFAARPNAWRSLLAPGIAVAVLTAALHWGFTLDPSAARISWMPPMHSELFARIVSVCFGFEDSMQFGWFSQALYTSGAFGVCVCLALSASAIGCAPVRPAVGAAAITLLLVVVYSAFVQPIFWYRSIAPAIVLLCFAAAAATSAAAPVAVVWGTAVLVLWHGSIFAQMAHRPVDPVEAAAKQALVARAPGEPLWIYPGMLGITLQPSADADAWQNVRAIDSPAPPVQGGVAFVRCDLPMFYAEGGLASLLVRPVIAARRPHTWIIIHNDNDDISVASQKARDVMLQGIVAQQPGCRIVSATHDRIARLECDTAQAVGFAP